MDKRALAIFASLLALSFLLGRFSAPVKVETKIETKIVEVEKKTEIAKKDEDVTIEQIIERDGRTTTRTHIKMKQDRETTASKSETESKSESKVIDYGRGVNVSVLAGYKSGIVYGASFSKNIIGPLTIGAWGLSNATFGVSIGLQL